MPAIRIRPDLYSTFNFTKDTKTPIGHISSLKIGKVDFKKNLNVPNPIKTNPSQTESQNIIAAITAIRWDGNLTDPIIFTCRIDASNKNKAATLIHNGLKDEVCSFAFSCYQHNDETKNYYKYFFSETELKGSIEKNNGIFELDIDPSPSEIISSPRNYELYISIQPKIGITQTLKHAFSESTLIEKKWGA